MTEEPKYVYPGACLLGTDPEIFLVVGGKVQGSEKIVPADGLIASSTAKVVQDGVQIELHPHPSHCRQHLASYIAQSMFLLAPKLQALGDAKISFQAAVRIDKEELDSLSEKAKMFGCAPSKNAYKSAGNEISVNAATYTKRHAGGHIHLGLQHPYVAPEVFNKHREKLAPILDTILGNTCVLLDRDPDAAERRQHYGRAGEFRLPKHGFEYRTLSNFWLRSYQLMSLVFAVARQGVGIWEDTYQGSAYYNENGVRSFHKTVDYEGLLLERVNLDDVQKAINTNDLELAYKNWEVVKKFIVDHVSPASNGLTPGRIKRFETFAKNIQKNGFEHYFPEDPFTHWCNFANGLGTTAYYASGWETFADNRLGGV